MSEAQLAERDLVSDRAGRVMNRPAGINQTYTPRLSAAQRSMGRWLTPPFSPIRFDAVYFGLELPAGEAPVIWPGELTEGGWDGAWVKPGSFSSDGVRFGNIKMPSVERQADSGKAIGDWAEITFDDPRPNAEPDQFRFRLIGGKYSGTDRENSAGRQHGFHGVK